MSPNALVVSDLAVGFGDAPGLREISFALARGERLAVVGASGAGKTTLLRAVAGLVPVQRGTIAVAGRDVTRLPPELRGAAYLHQSPLLFPHLSVGENVAFPLRLRRRPEAEIRRRVDELLSAVGLPDLGSRAPRTLSGGQRHRVALARAMAADPAVLLLDEPLSALDPTLRQEVRGALLALHERYASALLLVTHDLDEAALIAHRLAVLLDGAIAQIATPAELFRRPASLPVARFLGIRNELAVRVTADGRLECALGSFPVPASYAAGEIMAFFPPEAIGLTPSADGSARVLEVRHGVHGTTALVSVSGVVLEAGLPWSTTLVVGDAVHVRIDPERLILLGAHGGGGRA